MTEPTDTLLLDISKTEEQHISRALGASTLEYETTMTTRFMVGTETGLVISCNRKGKNAVEKLATRYNAHLGPVYSVQRNTAFLKNFLTVGDWTVRIWAEDCRESCIVWTAYHRSTLRDACWSPARFSIFYVIRDDGVLDAWDVLQQQHSPILTVKASDSPLRRIRPHEDGRLLAVGNYEGTTYLLEMSENMATNTPRDKPFLTAMFERESKREKIIEARMREIRLKMAAKPATQPDGEDGKHDRKTVEMSYWEDPAIITAHNEYLEAVEKDELNYGNENKEEESQDLIPNDDET